jgi:hypothetical protein
LTTSPTSRCFFASNFGATSALNGSQWNLLNRRSHTFYLDLSAAIGLATFILGVAVSLTLVQMLRKSEQGWRYLASIVESSDTSLGPTLQKL